MDKIKLTYFDFPGGRGEASRIALHLAGVEWIDDRVRGDWPQRKPNTPFGGLPVLEVPGKGILAQSCAILSYLGRTYGLLPEDPFEAARHEGVMQAVEDLRAQVATTGRDDEEEKKAARIAFAEGYLASWLGQINAQIRGPFVGGDTLSVADLKLYVALVSYRKGVYDHVPSDVLDAWPAVTGLMAAVEAHPDVASWLAR